MAKSFKVNNYKDLMIGVSLLTLLAMYTYLKISSHDLSSPETVLTIAAMTILSAMFISSYFLVKSIEIYIGKISILPAGVEISGKDIKEVTAKSEAALDAYGRLDRIEIAMKTTRIKWIPLNLLWARNRISLRLVGVKESAEVFREITRLKNSN